jgi:Protein of unknown function (DUF3551)
MNNFLKLAVTGALALFVCNTPATASPTIATGAMPHYCLYYSEGGTDCSFVSLAQCNATASGIRAGCTVDYKEALRSVPITRQRIVR